MASNDERLGALEREVAELRGLLLQHCVNHLQPVPMPYYGGGINTTPEWPKAYPFSPTVTYC